MAITYDQVFGALNKRDKELAQLIMPREGFSSTVYSDVDRQGTETGLAAGFGHRLTDEELKQFKVGDEIPHKQAVDWLRADIARTNEASWKQAYEVPNATEQLQDALHKVNFQLGPGWTQKFPTAWEHMKAGRWDQAIEEIKFTKEGSGQESKWMKQTPERAKDFITALQTQHEASFEKVPSMPEYTEPMAKHWSEPDEEVTLDQNITMYRENPDMLKEEVVKKFKPKPLTGVAEQRLNNFNNVVRAGVLTVDDTLPYKALFYYLTDSAQAHFKSMFGGLFSPLPRMFKSSQDLTDFHRTFEPSSMFEQKHYDALDNFIRTNPLDHHKPTSKKPGWSSIDINAPKYKNLRDKDPSLEAMANTVGKVDFKIDPKTGRITYSDSYDFEKGIAAGVLGPSKGPEYEFTNPKK